ncbi:MAG: LPS export ABC transporter permease LptF [Alphaproteobacteria bacterium]
MLGITRYILKQLAVGTVLVTVALICILWLSQSLRFVDLLVKKGLTIGGFVQLTLLLLPNFAVILTPIAMFAVVLFTYNRLTMDRELVVLKATGFSDFRLAKAAIVLGSVLTVLGYTLSLYVVPLSVERFRAMQWTIRNDFTSVLLQEGAFTEVLPGLTVYVRSRSSDGELRGILVHDKRNVAKVVTMMAERGALVLAGHGPRVLMVNGNRQDVGGDEGRLSLLYFDSYTVDLSGTGKKDQDRSNDPRERSLRDLLTMTERDGLEVSDVRRFRVEAHQRLTGPLFNLSLAALALATLLPGPFHRRGHTARIIAAVILMVIVEATGLGAAAAAGVSLEAIPLMYLNAIGPLVLAFYVLIRPPEWLIRFGRFFRWREDR